MRVPMPIAQHRTECIRIKPDRPIIFESDGTSTPDVRSRRDA